MELNKLTYKDRALQAGPHNFFRLESGARPSFGIFQCDEGTYGYLFDNARLPNGGNLVFSDGIRTVTLHDIYVVEARPARGYASAGFPSGNDCGLYDLILADARILWLNTAGDKNYNMYKADRTLEVQEGYSESENWTWVDMIDDLATLAGATIEDNFARLAALTSEPRNIMAKGRPVADVLEETLSFLGLVMIPGIIESSTYYIQYANDYNKDWLTNERKKLVFEGGPVSRNDLILPKNIGLRVSSGPVAKIELTATAEYDAKGSGSLYLDVKHAGELDENGELQNTDELTALRGDLIASHSQPNPELMVTLVGIHDLVSDGFTDVEWRSTSEGAFTRGLVRKPKVKATRPEDGLFNYGAFYLDNRSVFPVTLSPTSETEGDHGDSTTQCGYEYDVADAITGEKLAGAGTDPAVDPIDPISPPHKWVRPTVGYMIAASFGYAYRDKSNTLIISWINEVADQSPCS